MDMDPSPCLVTLHWWFGHVGNFVVHSSDLHRVHDFCSVLFPDAHFSRLLVLGVGADDVFVMTDGWKQSVRDVVPVPGETKKERLVRRMTYAYGRTASGKNKGHWALVVCIGQGVWQ